MMPKVKFNPNILINNLENNFTNPSLNINDTENKKNININNYEKKQKIKKYKVHLSIIGKNINSKKKVSKSIDYKDIYKNNKNKMINEKEKDISNSNKFLYSVIHKKKSNIFDFPI